MNDSKTPNSQYDDHFQTYLKILLLMKIAIVVTITMLLSLIIFSNGGFLSVAAGTVLVIASIGTGLAGLFAGDRGWIAPTAIMILTGLAVLLLA